MPGKYVIYCVTTESDGTKRDKLLCEAYDEDSANLIVNALRYPKDTGDVNYSYKIKNNSLYCSKSNETDLGCGA
jgi:hypothetical protein